MFPKKKKKKKKKGERPDHIFGSDVLSNFNKPSHNKEEVHQIPMAIVTRLVVQEMLLRSSDQGKVLIQPDLQEEKRIVK